MVSSSTHTMPTMCGITCPSHASKSCWVYRFLARFVAGSHALRYPSGSHALPSTGQEDALLMHALVASAPALPGLHQHDLDPERAERATLGKTNDTRWPAGTHAAHLQDLRGGPRCGAI